MSTEDFRTEARAMLAQMLLEAPTAVEREQFLDAYADALTGLYGKHAHVLLNDIIEDARTRLDARLSPDPIRQTIATVQTTVQDLWKNLWQ